MATSITITDLPAEGAELSEETLRAVSGGMFRQGGCGSSKTLTVGDPTPDHDADF